ncbi:MAG: thioredoxin fold domain-containing protein [Alphaproteobacteria bacterium]|jgi:thioredoxin-related protein|nr:thioredoxin fold domain-containing protein [Alphaproteobacteria bacterium]MBT6387588.1 thioredoxin fold domain-containing protein [Alphaproteobacteria bacterium]
MMNLMINPGFVAGRSWISMLIVVAIVLLVGTRELRAEFQTISLDNDLATEIEDAAADGKRLIVMFHEEGCPWCNKMRERIFPHPKIAKYFSDKFVMIEEDIKGDLELTTPGGELITQKAFARRLRVRGTPTFVFYDTDGKIAARIPGYQDVATFIASGRYVHEKIFKTGKSLVRWQMEQ